MATWTWYGHPVYRYRDEKGRFTSAATVRAWGTQSINGTAAEMTQAALTLAPQDFGKLLREQIKAEVIRQYLLGKGGKDQLDQADYGVMGGVIADQYRYLDKMLAKYEAGELSAARVAALARMYINSTREAYERAAARTRGLPLMPAYPGDGSTICLTNCKCYWDYVWANGRWECYWRLSTAEHCPGCLAHNSEWSPLIITIQGEIVNE